MGVRVIGGGSRPKTPEEIKQQLSTLQALAADDNLRDIVIAYRRSDGEVFSYRHGETLMVVYLTSCLQACMYDEIGSEEGQE